MVNKHIGKVLLSWGASIIALFIWNHRKAEYPNLLAETERKITIQTINDFYDSMPTHDEAIAHIDDLVNQIVASNSYLTDRELVRCYVETAFRLAKK